MAEVRSQKSEGRTSAVKNQSADFRTQKVG
jgi:hypothetical protein